MSGASCREGNVGDAGVLERPFRRWCDRARDEGLERLRDCRIGKLSSRVDLTGQLRRA
jgi:hypothetical protein